MASGQGGRDAIAVMQRNPRPGATPSIASINRRCAVFANSTSRMPHTTVRPAMPVRRDQIRQHPRVTLDHSSTSRKCSAISGTISTTKTRFAGIPPASNAREITPVPAPSSTTTSSPARRVLRTIRWQIASDKGTIDPFVTDLPATAEKTCTGLTVDILAVLDTKGVRPSGERSIFVIFASFSVFFLIIGDTSPISETLRKGRRLVVYPNAAMGGFL
jgi:hypothetical protein